MLEVLYDIIPLQQLASHELMHVLQQRTNQ